MRARIVKFCVTQCQIANANIADNMDLVKRKIWRMVKDIRKGLPHPFPTPEAIFDLFKFLTEEEAREA